MTKQIFKWHQCSPVPRCLEHLVSYKFVPYDILRRFFDFFIELGDFQEFDTMLCLSRLIVPQYSCTVNKYDTILAPVLI